MHKYEHGVVPEPKRLVELARVGRTTVEWILTGRHWEDGDEGRERLPLEVYRIARAAAGLSADRLDSLSEALKLLERAAAEAPGNGREGESEELPAGLSASARALGAALRLHRRVVETALEIEARAAAPRTRVELVLVHPDDAEHPRGAAAWLEVRPQDGGPWVFIGLANHSEGALTANSVWQILHRRADLAGATGPRRRLRSTRWAGTAC